MASQQPKERTPGWRSRREEYLRASGRQSDLVKEGFEETIAKTSWTVIAGGRTSRSTGRTDGAGLFLVKGMAS